MYVKQMHIVLKKKHFTNCHKNEKKIRKLQKCFGHVKSKKCTKMFESKTNAIKFGIPLLRNYRKIYVILKLSYEMV